ncbi:unnamed protein product [Lactuca saligna]|uniref:Thioredoxin domain-containing protein n=1 Tax=Lactuca saligna TaxID=75948 RepID=A0AA35ZGL2_LACSI|nr:unnamed protein product [Lactuca saligna]
MFLSIKIKHNNNFIVFHSTMDRSTKVFILISFFFLSVISNFNLVHAEELFECTFDQAVMKSQDKWIVQFLIPQCGAVKGLKPEWDKASANMCGKVKFGEVNCQNSPELCGKYKVPYYPYILQFGTDKTKEPIQYQGDRSASALEEAALKIA